jgi:hypothetical protein
MSLVTRGRARCSLGKFVATLKEAMRPTALEPFDLWTCEEVSGCRCLHYLPPWHFQTPIFSYRPLNLAMATTGTYPEGTQFWQTADYKGKLLRDMNASLIAISTIILGTRLYVRFVMTKTSGLDDIFATFAWVGSFPLYQRL